MGSPLDIILTIVVLSFWFLFPLGMFISVAHVDKNTDQVIRLEHLRHGPMKRAPALKVPLAARGPVLQFRKWIHH